MGVPALLDAMRATGRSDEMPTGEPTADQKRLQAESIAARGYWSETWDKVLALTSVLGVHTMAVGVPALLAELKRAEDKKKQS